MYKMKYGGWPPPGYICPQYYEPLTWNKHAASEKKSEQLILLTYSDVMADVLYVFLSAWQPDN